MPRFNIKRYDPREDSSAAHIQFAGKTKCLVLATVTEDGRTGCPCGCGGMPVGAKAVFLMGHDARLRGKLIRAHLTDTKVIRVLDGKIGQPELATDVAAEYGESFTDALTKAEARREDANRGVLQRALNSRRLIRVGRWEYTGQVVAVYEPTNGAEGTFDVEYVTSQGKTKVAKGVPVSKAQEVTA